MSAPLVFGQCLPPTKDALTGRCAVCGFPVLATTLEAAREALQVHFDAVHRPWGGEAPRA